MADCLYCSEPIEAGQEVVRGVEAVAHRTCVHKELDQYCPTWRETEAEQAVRRGKASAEAQAQRWADAPSKPKTASRPKKRLRGPCETKRADPIFGLSSKAFR